MRDPQPRLGRVEACGREQILLGTTALCEVRGRKRRPSEKIGAGGGKRDNYAAPDEMHVFSSDLLLKVPVRGFYVVLVLGLRL